MNSWRFMLWVLIQYFVLLLKLLQLGPLGGLSAASCAPLIRFFICFFLSTFLFFDTARYFRLILCISCHRPRISHFSKESFPFLMEDGIRNQDLGSYYCFLSFGLSSFFFFFFSSLLRPLVNQIWILPWQIEVDLLSIHFQLPSLSLLPQTRLARAGWGGRSTNLLGRASFPKSKF